MSAGILVSTRKGLFTFVKGAQGWQVKDTAFLGIPVTYAMKDRRDGALYASLNHGHFGVKLHRSEDQGVTWPEVTAPQYDSDSGHSLEELWVIEPGGRDAPGTLWAGTIPGGLFHSKDKGETWSLNRSLWNVPQKEEWFGGGFDQPGIHSIIVDPDNADHVTIGISVGGVWETKDGGQTWENLGEGLRAEYVPPDQEHDLAIQDPHMIVQCGDVLWMQHHNGMFRSIDRGKTWRELKDVPVSNFGFAVAVHPGDEETAWFVPAIKDELRYPVDGEMVVLKTTDGGRSFRVCREGLPQKHAYDLVYRHALDVDETGSILAMGSTTGSLWISDNGGDNWTLVNAHLPPIYAVRFM